MEIDKPKPRILLADNDSDFRAIATEFLTLKGFTVIQASDEAETRRVLTEEPVALAIIDYRLTNDSDSLDNSGLNLARDTDLAGCVPRIILTGFGEFDYAREALRPDRGGTTPVVDFVTKAEGLDTLLLSIQRTIIRARIFLCYAHSDQSTVSQLYDNLTLAGFSPWIDEKGLLGGQNWRKTIGKIIREAHFFLVCISSNSVNRQGFIQKEIRMALDVREELPDEDIFIIPVRLEDCNVTHETLQELQWINLYAPDGFRRLIYAIRSGMRQRGLLDGNNL